MDATKQMTVEEALAAADRMSDPRRWIEEFMGRGLDVVDTLAAEVRRLTAALAAARREGAEEMRKRARQRTEVAAVDAGVVDNTVTRRWLLRLAREIDALPLDAPEHATTPAPVCPAPTEGT